MTSSVPKERPIIFSGAMVRAILAGNKTQTRRILKLPGWCELESDGDAAEFISRESGCLADPACQYGFSGDRLWVRETWALENDSEYAGEFPLPTDGRTILTHGNEENSWHTIPRYRATEPDVAIMTHFDSNGEWDGRTHWRPSIFMPRWASRITLEITEVRAEWLQAITNADAAAEGVVDRSEFQILWGSIYGAKPGRSWDDNPLVWVVAMRMCTGDRMQNTLQEENKCLSQFMTL